MFEETPDSCLYGVVSSCLAETQQAMIVQSPFGPREPGRLRADLFSTVQVDWLKPLRLSSLALLGKSEPRDQDEEDDREKSCVLR